MDVTNADMTRVESEAEARIAEHRQGDFRVHLCAADGGAIPWATETMLFTRAVVTQSGARGLGGV
jgi:hypothetical protein